MKKIILSLIFALMLSFTSPFLSSVVNSHIQPQEVESTELQFQDMLMLFLLPEIDKTIENYYSKLLSRSPIVYPYMIKIVNVKRVNGFRSFHFLITIEVFPVIGPHIAVGKDQLTFEISPVIPNTSKLVKFEHLETYELPENWNSIKIKKI